MEEEGKEDGEEGSKKEEGDVETMNKQGKMKFM